MMKAHVGGVPESQGGDDDTKAEGEDGGEDGVEEVFGDQTQGVGVVVAVAIIKVSQGRPVVPAIGQTGGYETSSKPSSTIARLWYPSGSISYIDASHL